MTILTTRRAFSAGMAGAGSLVLLPSIAFAATAAPTARTVIDRIKTQCAREGVPWAVETVDTWKIGDPDTPVRGVVSTFMGTLEVMRQTAALGANLIVSHEPIFYNHFDETDALATDPVYDAKVRYAKEHGLIVWRFHDHWHRLKPEPMSVESIKRLGWEKYRDQGWAGFSRRFTRPAVALDALVREMTRNIPSKSIRVIGDPALQVTKIAQIGHSIGGLIDAFETCDVAIAPEIREFDCAEYTRDAMALGQKKALILIAHERGEEYGMLRCRDWLRPLVPEAPVTFIDATEPFRTLRYA